MTDDLWSLTEIVIPRLRTFQRPRAGELVGESLRLYGSDGWDQNISSEREGFSRASALREHRRVVVARARRRRQVGIGADHDLIDRGAVLALLDPQGVRAGRREVDGRARRPPPVVGPAPGVIGARVVRAAL